MKGRSELERYGIRQLTSEVSRVDEYEADLLVETTGGDRIPARSVIIATGVRDRLPDVPGLAERWGRTVLHCPYCHGWEVGDQRLGVLATSELSLHQVQLIRQWSDRVTLFDAGLGAVDATMADRLRARKIIIVRSPVARVIGDGELITGVQTEDGAITPVDAVFTGGVLEPLDGCVAGLDLPRTDSPFGSFLTVDPTGRTGHRRIWAVGNVVNPGANVAMAMSSGAVAGSAINFELITDEFDTAVGRHPAVGA